MSRFAAEALDANGKLERRPWPADQPLRLQAAAGAEAAQVRLLDGERALQLLEAPASGDEPVHILLDDRGRLATSFGTPLLRLPPETPARQPRRPITAVDLDVAVLVDATRLHLHTPDEDAPSVAVPMLATAQPWAAERSGLVRIVEKLGGNADTARVSVIAFGDRAAPFPVAEDLRPTYRLAPAAADRLFEPFSRPGLEQRLETLRPSPGGDAVDAVAEALLAAADLPWRAEVRRLVLLLGDSPGYSISDPPPKGAASSARRHCLEEAAATLFAHRIDLATFFLPPAAELVAADAWRDLLHYTERQYRRLASLPEWAFRLEAGGLEQLELPRQLLEPPEWLGHGPTLGFFL